MPHSDDLNTEPLLPESQDAASGTPLESAAPLPADVVPPEIQRELPPHTEVRLVYWLRREYWTRLITPVVSTFEQRKAQ
jgi:hypothetical protein